MPLDATVAEKKGLWMSSRIYHYRKTISWARYLVPPLLNLPPLLGLAIHASGASPSEPVPLLHLYLILLSTIILGFLFGMLFRRMAKAAFSIQEDTIRYTCRPRTSEFHLGEISRIKFPSLQYCGGWMTIVSKKEVLRVTCALKNIDQFLLDLRSSLDACGLSDRYDRDQFYKFLKTATYAIQSGERLEKHMGVFALGMILSISISALCLSITGINNFGSLAALIVFVGPVGIYFATEYVLLQNFKSRCDEGDCTCSPPPTELEESVYREAKWAWAALCVIGVVSALIVRVLRENSLNLF